MADQETNVELKALISSVFLGIIFKHESLKVMYQAMHYEKAIRLRILRSQCAVPSLTEPSVHPTKPPKTYPRLPEGTDIEYSLIISLD